MLSPHKATRPFGSGPKPGCLIRGSSESSGVCDRNPENVPVLSKGNRMEPSEARGLSPTTLCGLCTATRQNLRSSTRKLNRSTPRSQRKYAEKSSVGTINNRWQSSLCVRPLRSQRAPVLPLSGIQSPFGCGVRRAVTSVPEFRWTSPCPRRLSRSSHRCLARCG